MHFSESGGDGIQQLVGQTMALYFGVDILLTMGTNCFFRGDFQLVQAALAALYGSLYAGVCLFPEMYFLTGFHWRLLSLVFTALLAFLGSADWFRKCLVYFLLHMAISGIVQSVGISGFTAVLLMSLGVVALGIIALPEIHRKYLPVELKWGERKLKLTALRDTGNNLRDPVTGRPVLVVDAVAAEKLVGLSRQQLCQPLETMMSCPGFRLIPYKTIGNTGFLLALKISDMRIGTWKGCGLVAFSPEILSTEGAYQALTGGMVY